MFKVKPLDNDWEIKKQRNRVLHVLEFEVAERLILGARFRQAEINPLDYIYSALGARIRPLEPGKPHTLWREFQFTFNPYKNEDCPVRMNTFFLEMTSLV